MRYAETTIPVVLGFHITVGRAKGDRIVELTETRTYTDPPGL